MMNTKLKFFVAGAALSLFTSHASAAPCSTHADATKLFGQALNCIDRVTFARAVVKAGGQLLAKEQYIDRFRTDRVFDLSETLEVSYTQRREFSFAQYTVKNTSMDHIKHRLALKYGDPDWQVGTGGERQPKRYTWQTWDDIRIELVRGWPDTTVMIRYIHPRNDKPILLKPFRVSVPKHRQEDAY